MCNKALIRKNVINIYLGFCDTLGNVGHTFIGYDQTNGCWFIKWFGDGAQGGEIPLKDTDMYCLLGDPFIVGQKHGWDIVAKFDLHKFHPNEFPVESLPEKLKPTKT